MKNQCPTIADIEIASPYSVYAINLGHYIFTPDPDAPGDIPPDIACLPVIGMRAVDSVLYIDTICN